MCVGTLFVLLLLLTASVSHGLQDGVAEEEQQGGAAPEIVEEPTEEIVRRNDPLTLYCKATGVPPPKILWFRTDSETPLRDRDSRLQLPDGSLFFYRVRGRDRGTYYCVARSPAGTATSRRATVQMAYLRENFRSSPSNLGVNEGDTAVFECDPPKGHPTPVVTWRLDGQVLILPRHRYRQEGTRLMVSNVVPSDEGQYQCVVTNMAGQRTSTPATLTVYEAARVGGVVKSMVGVAGHDVTLPCAPAGTPEPQVVWRRGDGLMPVGRAAVGRDWSLTITSVRLADQGVYVCQASNTGGSHAANTTLMVVERPRVEGGLRARVAIITPTHVRKIACPVTATPPPVIFWVKENHGRQEAQRTVAHEPLPDGEDGYQEEARQPLLVVSGGADGLARGGAAMVDHDYSLHVATRHEGLWACMAANEVGGMTMPVRVVGGGVARGSVGVGVVGVDEVEAREALLTPTLEQGYPASSTPTAATLTWRTIRQPTHMEGTFILGCERGGGSVYPRIQQQLQTHDISLHHGRYEDTRHPALPHHQATTSLHRSLDMGGRSLSHSPDAGAPDALTSQLLPTDGDVSSTLLPENATGTEGVAPPEAAPARPRCSGLRVLGHTLLPGRTSYTVHDLRPFTSYWFLLLPHYKGVLGVPSNLQAFTTPQDAPSGWAVLTRWWSALGGDGLYTLTLHWRPVPPHLAHGVILKYLVTVKESDTGLVHNVTVLGDLTTLTLPNVTSSRVEVTLRASTVKGSGPPSPPARLNLLMTHLKEPGVGVGVVRSAWFLVLAGGAVAMVVVLVTCTVTARWCARGLHNPLPTELSKGVCSVGGPWVDVGGLWTPVTSHDLNSDKSERKLLTSNGSAAEYAEVEANSQVKDDLVKARLEVWPGGLLCPSPSPSSASSQRTRRLTQTESLPSRAGRCQTGHLCSSRQHSAAPPSSSCRDSDTSTWYTGECCSYCRDDTTLTVPQEPLCPSTTPSGCSTVLQVNVDRSDLQSYSPEYQYSAVGTDTYEAVTAYEDATALGGRGRGKTRARCPLPPPRQDLRQLRLNTESTTDLSMDDYNFSDDEDDITQSCSDTEASFFIPHDRKREPSGRGETKADSPCDDIHRPFSNLFRLSCAMDDINFPSEFLRASVEERSKRDKKSVNSSKSPDQNTESFPASNTSSLNPLVADGSETSSTRRVSCRSSFSQDSLEEQFERTLSMISHGVSENLD